MKKIVILFAVLFWGRVFPAWADAPAAVPAASAASAAAAAAPTTTKASEMDCDKLQDKVLGELNALRTNPDSITADKCKLSSSARADSEELEVGEKQVKGACQATYASINHYADLAQKKLGEVCEIVQSAKAISANCETGQKTCLSGLAVKDKAAAAKLKELSAILKKAKKDLAAKQKKLKEVAEKYKKAFANIDDAIVKAGPNGNLQSTLSGVPIDVFGSDATNGWTALSSNGFDGSSFSTTYQQYNSQVESGFDSDGQPAPAGLGRYTEELAAANTSAAQAIKTVDVAAPKVETAQQGFETRAATLDGSSVSLGGISPSNTGSVASSLSAVPVFGAALAKSATGASKMIAASSGLAGALSNGSSDKNAQSLPTSGSGTAKLSAPSSFGPLPGTDAVSVGDSNGPFSPTRGSTETPANTDASKNEILSSFTALGPVSEGDELDIKAAHNRMAAAQGSNLGLSAVHSFVGENAKLPSTSPDSAGINGSGASIAMGVRNTARAASADANAASKSGAKGDTASLREALRRRLADRLKAGDAAASATVEEILYASQDRAPASVAPSSDIISEQAGPQGIDSEPLFSRVHHAHRRFVQRAYPRQAGL